MKKLIYYWVPYDLTDHKKAERDKIYKGTLKLISVGGHRLVFKIINSDETASTEKNSVCHFLQNFMAGFFSHKNT